MENIQYYDGPSKIAPDVRGAKTIDRPFATQMAGISLQRKEANWRPLASVRMAPFWLFLLTFLCAFGRTSMAAPAVSYGLTTTTDPALPGKFVQFRNTVTNLTTSNQYVTLSYKVPNFTSYGGYPAGTALSYTIGYVAPGVSETVNFDFTVLSGAQTPLNGSLITLVISDLTRGLSVSRTATVRSAPTASLSLSTQQSTVAPGGSFAYTLAFQNTSAAVISGSQLSLPVPAGASYVFADSGGVLGADGVIRWTPGTLAAGATRQVHVNLKAATTTGTLPALLLQAVWKNSAGQILAQASDTKAVYAIPAVFYALTTNTDPVGSGKTLQFRFTVTNLATTSQYVTLSYHVPNFTSRGGYPAGTLLTYTVGYVAPGASETVNFDFTVLSGSQTPLDGSLSTLVISDDARGASVSRTAIVRTAPTATLDLSTPQGTVAPGGNFSYTLAFHNASAGAISGSQLSLPVPVGASFVSAEGGAVLGSDDVVRLAPGTLPAGATSQVHVHLKAATAGTRSALLLQAVWKDSGGLILAQASDAKSIYSTPAVSYALTTTTDPVGSGKTLQFRTTVTNLATTNQYVTFSYHVPNFTTRGGYPAGTLLTYTVGYVAPGASQTVNFDFTVLSGSQTPPDGSLSTLVISDDARGASLSRTAIVRTAPTATLDLSTLQGTVSPGGSFAYTLAFHNASPVVISGSHLSLAVPLGASFVFADAGGVLGADGVVRWAPGTLPAGATTQVHVNFKAATTTGALPALLLEATSTNNGNQILAQASDAKAIYATPAVSYSLTTTTDPIGPGKTLQFKFTATNKATTNQYVTLSYHVPNFTTYGGYPAGTLLTYTIGYVAPGASQSVNLSFTVLSGSQTPPKGSLITLVISDNARGAALSRTVTVNP